MADKKRVFTPAQQSAVDTAGKTLLVSAAAGSGKTAVLTARIISLLTDPENPVNISRLLVVTFTRSAAAELGTRIRAALTEALAKDPTNERLLKQLTLFGSARISTIDSFYLDLVRTHFDAVGFPPSFRIADPAELESLKRRVMNETVDAMYRDEPDFPMLADILCALKSEDSLTKNLCELCDKFLALPESIELLHTSADDLDKNATNVWHRHFFEEMEQFAAKEIDFFTYTLQYIESFHDPDRTKKYQPVHAELLERSKRTLQYAQDKDLEGLLGVLTAPISASVSGKTIAEQLPEEKLLLGKLYAVHRNAYKELREFLRNFSPTLIRSDAAKEARVLRVLYKTLSRFLEALFAEKKTRGIFDFSDVARGAYELLIDKNGEPTPLARGIRDSFDGIYIDEYQDVNALQDATFRAISKEDNRFMVGDIKQSIYRFRHARPDIFADYRRKFKPLGEAGNEKEALIFMSDCFRCDRPVIHFSNAVFNFLFGSSKESIGYDRENDNLNFPKEKKDPPESFPCRVLLLEHQGNKDECRPAEANCIAREIENLLKNGKRADGRPIEPRDIAVLFRKHTATNVFLAKALEARGISCQDKDSTQFFTSPEVLTVYGFLAAIHNPFRDVFLAAALRSPFFGFTLEEIVRVRSGSADVSLYESLSRFEKSDAASPLAKKVREALALLSRYRKMARTLPTDDLVRAIYRETALLSFTGYEDGSSPKKRRANLRRFYEYARNFEQSGFKGLGRFITYLEDIMSSTEVNVANGNKNAVSILTIHGAKGLEFPICILGDAADDLSPKENKKLPIAIDPRLGCAAKLSNAGPISRAKTFEYHIADAYLDKQAREEEMRILYVAMTRAIEQLIVVATVKSREKQLYEQCDTCGLPQELFYGNGNSFIEWILTALSANPCPEWVKVENVELPVEEATPSDPPTLLVSEAEQGENALKTFLSERFDFVYPYAHLTRLPAKLSVSRLSPVALDVFDSDRCATPQDLAPEDTERLLHTFTREANFGKKTPSAAERGTATHEFLQFCDFTRVRQTGVTAELARLIEGRFLPERAADAVRVDELERFFASDFFAALQKAKSLHRETRFHIFLPAASFTADKTFAAELAGEKLPVQGVIDVFFTDETDALILADYKTDRLSDYEMRNPAAAAETLSRRHGQQLAYYALALRALTGHAPDKVLIYSLPLGKALPVTLPEI